MTLWSSVDHFLLYHRSYRRYLIKKYRKKWHRCSNPSTWVCLLNVWSFRKAYVWLLSSFLLQFFGMLSVCVITCQTGNRRSGYQPLYAWTTSCIYLPPPHFVWLSLLTTSQALYKSIQANHCTNIELIAYKVYTRGRPCLSINGTTPEFSCIKEIGVNVPLTC